MKRTAVLFAVFILIVIILADTDHLPRSIRVIYDYPHGDKLGHFALFGLLNFFTTRAFIQALPSRIPGRVALSTGFALALLIGVEELSQRLFATRTFDLIDLFASYLGLIVGGIFALKLKK